QEQHRVYAALYRRVREAADRFSGMIGLTSRPDFEKYDVKKALGWLERAKLDESDASEALAAYTSGNSAKAASVMKELERRVNWRDAQRAFTKAKNIEALYELYLSDAVRARMNAVRASTATVTVNVMRDNEDRVGATELYQNRLAMETAVADLYTTMRQELRDGTSADLPSTD
ncbi:MAG: CLH domain-containing protein, partial [Verrucomicrobiota bacterium]|nr:CLH domain-containing protein [Verrucomicrobiota bacterium]